MEIKELGTLLGFDRDFFNSVLETNLNLSNEKLNYFINGLSSNDYDKFFIECNKLFQDDKLGFKMLKIMLLTACKSYDFYLEKNIDIKIFIDSMKSFSRFSKEHFNSYGKYGFDRGFWTGRFLSLNEFRLGCLEFEMVKSDDNVRTINVHIPSDSILSKKEIDNSLKLSKDFFKKYFPEFYNVKYYCLSWLLSPTLIEEKMLKLDSHIMTFMSYFNIIDSYESEDFKEWVFKDRNLDNLDNFECKTSLQQKIKDYIESGHKFLNGVGVLKI